ncbi:insulin-like peptide INSL5 precursor [Oryctolagus cuniculus]|uniref:Insulin-like 5 n=1 Tax=Oryctolagus cuniculus TaxID=9986 RepID=B1AAP9_RABIT|nr:insulin-like peptide INSL5 precursor [Oryctolagus cuniculus]ACA13577.1 insulin-like 5 [Oryctolagus cuniculus]
MKGLVLTASLFSVLLAAVSEVGGEGKVKLCGLEYVRTVVYICATSRWRRHLEGNPQAQEAERRNNFPLPNTHEVSGGNPAYDLLKVDFSGKEQLQNEQMPSEGFSDSKQRSVMSRQELQTLCCTDGCSMADLSALC